MRYKKRIADERQTLLRHVVVEKVL